MGSRRGKKMVERAHKSTPPDILGVHSQKSTIHQVTGGVDHIQHGEMGCNASGFLDVAVALEEEMLNLGENSTKQKNNWARKKFDAWREFSGIDSSIASVEMVISQIPNVGSEIDYDE
ncbi:hypothetical protein GOP47_0000352 [Adiantum capillus-veneris]|uniref:Uncharacterized protein n=1 Tax=Adiantum capillus-veneris TaxID=13818 RepID=A0A9D4VET7_ADICA|nr:hypothetical protein GOP47_0000352 [Adiantum capillus-veneris]